MLAGVMAVSTAVLTMGAGQDAEFSLAVIAGYAYVTDSQTRVCYVYQVQENGWVLVGTLDLSNIGAANIPMAH